VDNAEGALKQVKEARSYCFTCSILTTRSIWVKRFTCFPVNKASASGCLNANHYTIAVTNFLTALLGKEHWTVDSSSTPAE
jgi:hypothetical protein